MSHKIKSVDFINTVTRYIFHISIDKKQFTGYLIVEREDVLSGYDYSIEWKHDEPDYIDENQLINDLLNIIN